MEYTFGSSIRGGLEIDTLKTTGTEHSDLSGRSSVTREYTDSIITDVFDIIRKYASEEGEDGICYDWYEIRNHYRYEDRHTAQIGAVEAALTEMEILSMEQERQITDNEIAILELKEARNG